MKHFVGLTTEHLAFLLELLELNEEVTIACAEDPGMTDETQRNRRLNREVTREVKTAHELAQRRSVSNLVG